MFFLNLQTNANIQYSNRRILEYKNKKKKLVGIVMGIVLEINSLYSTILLVGDN